MLLDGRRLAGAYLSDRVAVEEAVVHRARPEHVHSVLVDGEVVVEAGRARRVVEEDVLTEVRQRMSVPWPGQPEADRRARVLVDAARLHYAPWLR